MDVYGGLWSQGWDEHVELPRSVCLCISVAVMWRLVLPPVTMAALVSERGAHLGQVEQSTTGDVVKVRKSETILTWAVEMAAFRFFPKVTAD